VERISQLLRVRKAYEPPVVNGDEPPN
jgi:hypothetical protein